MCFELHVHLRWERQFWNVWTAPGHAVPNWRLGFIPAGPICFKVLILSWTRLVCYHAHRPRKGRCVFVLRRHTIEAHKKGAARHTAPANFLILLLPRRDSNPEPTDYETCWRHQRSWTKQDVAVFTLSAAVRVSYVLPRPVRDCATFTSSRSTKMFCESCLSTESLSTESRRPTGSRVTGRSVCRRATSRMRKSVRI